MRAEYKRDMNHNYLIFCEEQEIDTSSYQIRMLVGNAIPSVLKCRVQGVDGKFMIYYDITSRQSVSTLFEGKKLGYEELQMIFRGFVKVMEEMSEYLLNPGRLVIRPEYMFVDMEKRELFFCYLPGFEEEVQKQFQSLTEYILPKLDHEDGNAVMLGYGVYRRALEECFHLEHIKEELFRERKEESTLFAGECSAKTEPEQEKEELDEDIWKAEDFFGITSDRPAEKADETKDFWHKLTGCIAAVLLILAVLAGRLLGYLPGISLETMLGILIAGIGMGMLFYLVWSRRKTVKYLPDDPNTENHIREARETAVKENRKEKAVEKQDSIVETTENFGETILLSAGISKGPSSLVSREPGELATIYLNEDLTVIGKLVNAADAVINLPTVSRVHAKIRKRGGEYYLTDLNSRNGTSVNGQMLTPDEDCLLNDQDEVDFAQARYIFVK